jgi:hypothetical protein
VTNDVQLSESMPVPVGMRLAPEESLEQSFGVHTIITPLWSPYVNVPDGHVKDMLLAGALFDV